MCADRVVRPRACETARAAFHAADLNWLLHRAAQRIGETLRAEVGRHGIGLRAQLVLSALVTEAGRTQLALGAALGLDKTTLTTVLDRLEREGYVRRRPDERDRRVRIPEITDAGREIQQRVGVAVRGVEDELLATLSPDEQKALEAALCRLVEAAGPEDAVHGSCM
jgi:DNA-binding MarR family transcriptional regulator